MKKYAHEFKVGMFILLCLAGLAYLAFSTGKFSFSKEGYNIYVTFDDVAGLNTKAPVMLNGFEVGKAEEVKLSYDNNKTFLTLKLRLDQDVKVRENSEISIKTLGLMGEKYIQITSSESGSFINPDTTVAGKPYVDIDTLMSNLNGIIDENAEKINAIADNFESLSEDIRKHPWKLLIKTKENK